VQVAKAVLSLARGTSFGSAITDGESPIQRLFQVCVCFFFFFFWFVLISLAKLYAHATDVVR
jgi:hypothetical protein